MTRLLIVEDSPTQAEELCWILESEGFEVDVAPDGASALARLRAERYHLVISDIVMPGMSGYDFCRALKSGPERSDVPVMLLTMLSDPMDIIQGLECGADNFLTKPCEPGYLLGRVRSMLESKRMRAAAQPEAGVEIAFLGRKFNIRSDKEQILDLLLSTFEDIVRKNRDLQQSQAELAAAKLEIEGYARRLEGRVRLSEEKYRALMDQANDAIFITDERGKILQVNRQTADLLGAPADQVAGRVFHDLVVPAERNDAAVRFEELLRDGRAQWSNVHLVRPGAGPVCTDLSASLVQTDGDRIVLVIARDMTERNRLHQQVLHNEKLVTVGTLTAGIAHEINNPTAVILGNLRAVAAHAEEVASLRDKLGRLANEAEGPLRSKLQSLHQHPGIELSSAELREILGDCKHAGERIRDIVRDLKGFARIDGGDVGLVNVHERIDTALRMAAHELRHRARIERRYAPDLPPIMASPGKLSQLFLNLIVNAAQAIDEGKAGQNVITIATALEGSAVRIDIADTGKGIAADILPNVFDPFFTTKPLGVGTGLGLSICHDIVKKHGGEIRVQSEPGRGTTFSIFLSRETALAPPRSLRPPALPDLRRLKMLLVDDDALVLKLYARMLGRHHELITALGGRAALETLATRGADFDVILSDIMMPDVDGVDLYRHVADELPGLEERMIFLTGGAFNTRASAFLERVPNPRLEKPFAPEDLLRAIGKLVPS
jgi:two-component system cell cycle sensor histidine kinase/response regulator CckA